MIDLTVERKLIYHHLPYSTARIPQKLIWLVVSTHLKNNSQNGTLPQIGMNIKNVWNHHLVIPVATSSPAFSASPAIIANRKWCGWRVASVGANPRLGFDDLDVSKNSGTPKSSILIGFSIINHPFWGIHIFWKHPFGYVRTYWYSYWLYLISPTKEWLNDTTLSGMIVVWYCLIRSKSTLHYTSKGFTRSLKTHISGGRSRRFHPQTFSISAHDRPFEQRLKGCLRRCCHCCYMSTAHEMAGI